MTTEPPTRPEFERPANPDGEAGGYVQLKNGEGTLADWIVCKHSYVSYCVGETVRRVPWDRIEYVDEYLEVDDER